MKLRDDFFISTTFCNNRNLKDVLKKCFDNKLTNLELGSTHLYDNNINKLIDRYQFNYLTHNFFPPKKNNLILNIASLNKSIRIESVNHIKYCMKFAKIIGSQLYTFHPGFIDDPLSTNIEGRNYDFKWINRNKNNFDKAFNKMLESLKIIIDFSIKIEMKVAIETEGSFKNSDKVLLQTPDDFQRLYDKIDKKFLNFNLNLGHLNLASRYYKFKKKDFIDIIFNNVVALEISHNNGFLDQHKCLTESSPCLNYIYKFKDKKIFKILEFRDTNIKDIHRSIKILKQKLK